MITRIMRWNEPDNLSHWDFQMDSERREFSTMLKGAARAIREPAPDLVLVLGGISPIDPNFIRLLAGYGALEDLDAVGVHGFPLDWNHWKIDEWPNKIKETEDVCPLPVWVTEVGASSFGAEEVQVFGIRRTNELLLGRVEHIFWYSLLDYAVDLLKSLGVKELRTGLSWADRYRPNALARFDRQMERLEDFDVTLTFCFTPPSRGRRPCHTSPPADPEEYARFSAEMVKRYVLAEGRRRAPSPGRLPPMDVGRPPLVPGSGERNRYEHDQNRDRRARQLREQPAPRP